ncbi:hypothetical protein A4A49_31879 [Nicotiana attenuata]|uniref:Uncharacterized protein n=1 Tax=Nicotiana attenuata TaxID=49451 RepID=A0A314KQB5_NICAT|nr:hypothetical protein A4A49_31879 [Nicotiana attenuata]
MECTSPSTLSALAYTLTTKLLTMICASTTVLGENLPPPPQAQEQMEIYPPTQIGMYPPTPPPSPTMEEYPQQQPAEDEVDPPETFMESLTLNDSLTISMPENIERKFLIFIPPHLVKTSLNVLLDPYSLEDKYVVLMIPTLNDTIQPASIPASAPSNAFGVIITPGGNSSQ